ncbi:MAG: ATP-binding protein [Proteobacteria bacterium]|nr:ATP-binding protein [Pseudomonadota bacterium]
MSAAAPDPAVGLLERCFPASMDEVESYVAEMHAYLRGCGVEDCGFELELMAREALGNAVRHGSRNDPAQSVSARLAVHPGRVELCVTDGGAGFDWHAKSISVPSPDSETGRGLCILKLYADTMEFNEAGNSICISKALPVEEELMSKDNDATVRLTLEANVSAKNTEELRSLFKQHVNEGARNLELDFSKVGSIDSVGIGLLVATHNSLVKTGGKLSLCNVSQDICQLFTLMRLDKHFHIAQALVEG